MNLRIFGGRLALATSSSALAYAAQRGQTLGNRSPRLERELTFANFPTA